MTTGRSLGTTFNAVVDPGMGRATEVASAVEAAGFDALFLGETSHDPLILLAAAAQSTSELSLGTSIFVAFGRSPMVAAIMANDVQALSGGRLHFGLGSQIKAHITRRFSMPWSRPAARMKEYVQAVNAIWDSWENGTPLKFEGDFYQHSLMTPMFDPGPNPYGRPPIMVAGVGEGMSRAAGEVADGFLVHSFVTDRYLEEVIMPNIEIGLAAAGRTRTDITVMVTPMLAAGLTDEQIDTNRENVRRQISFYGSTPAYRGVLDLHGWSDLHEELYVLSRQGRWDDMTAAVGDEVVDVFAVTGSVAQSATELKRRWGPVSDSISVALPTIDDIDGWSDALAAMKQPTGPR
ncbi:MAG: putative oxidoreductase [Pseudonocardiales bacterium]|nr:putative oxidoreductase [Pseudonocardiales bacterium]